jgi:beta-glucosidase
MASKFGHNAHRLSIEWSRLEPRPGRFDRRAVERYRQILGHARDKGLYTFVNINHFTLPRWIAKGGGWSSDDISTVFARYAKFCAAVFHDVVGAFLTINEPAVLAYKSYIQGIWPPGRKNPRLAARCMAQQLIGHAAAYHALKSIAPEKPVGLALNLPTIRPSRRHNARDRLAALAQDWCVNGVIVEALRHGRMWPPLGYRPHQKPRIPLAKALDFVGVNYYGCYDVRVIGGRPCFVQWPTVATETSDWGRPSAASFESILQRVAHLGVDVLITENGIFDATDTMRPDYIRQHVAAAHRALAAGVPLIGYLHWSLIDNFEWAQGWTTPFGLVALDPDTQKRVPKASAFVLSDICRRNGLI